MRLRGSPSSQRYRDGTVHAPLLQRKCACGGTCDDCAGKRPLQRAAVPGAHQRAQAPPIVHDVLRSQGHTLDGATRADMEPRFGHDFSRVRVHSGGTAARSAAAVGAEAYTVGQHIVLGKNAASPVTREGASLFAHELAHSIQQGSVGIGTDPLPISAPDDAGEREAHHMAERAATGSAAQPAASTPPQLARASRPFLLTFDDGPDGVNSIGGGKNLTEKVLDALCAKNVEAGFFVQTAAEQGGKPFRGSSTIGQTLIKRMSANGHRIGIHTGGTKDHEAHTSAHAAGRLTSELTSATAALTALTGKAPTMVRPPFGKSSKDVRAVYKSLGLTNVLWDIDADAKAKSMADIEANIRRDLKGVIARGWKGSTPLAPTIVTLLHDIRPNTAKNVGAIIDFIKAETAAQTKGKDAAIFPMTSCKSAALNPDAGDYDLPPDDGTRMAAPEEGSATTIEEAVA
jgi:peptidoglycan/xylan/chitin deacetylase (PgdA/CDA1 family)